MSQVLLTTLLLEYSSSSCIKVQKLMNLSESLYGLASDEYYDYIDQYTEPTEKKIANIMLESMAINESRTREYMGVTVYKGDDGIYSVPELGIYNVIGSNNVKDYIRNKLVRNKPTSFREEIETVFNNINYISNLPESELLNFILNEMSENDYKELGGTNFKNFVLVVSEIVNNDWEVPQSLILESYIFDEGIGDFIKSVKGKVSDAHLELAYKAPGLATALGDAYSRHTAATQGVKSKLDAISDRVNSTKAALGDAYGRHTAATQAAGEKINSTKAALGDAYGRHTAATQAAGKKINDAKEKAGRIYNKVDKILSPAPRSRQDTAAAKEKIASIYNKVDKVLSPPPMSQENKDALKQRASNVAGILDRMILSPRPTTPKPAPTTPKPAPTTPKPAPTTPKPAPATPKPAPTTPKPAPTTPKPAPTSTRSERKTRIRTANSILDQLRTDGDAEKAKNEVDVNAAKPIKTKTKKLTLAQKEAKYDKLMKEDLDIQLEYIKSWLYENEIFDNLEDIDNYILEDMTGEEYYTIISEISDEDGEHQEKLKSLVKLAKSNKLGKLGRKADPKERRNIADTNTALDTAAKFGTRYPNNHVDSTAGKDRKFMTIAQKMNATIDDATDKLAKFNKASRQEPGGSVSPAKPLDIKKSTLTTPLGKAIAPPTSQQRGMALVPYKNSVAMKATSGSYDTPPKTYEDRPLDSSYRSPNPSRINGVTSKPLGKAIAGNQHSLIDTPRRRDIPEKDKFRDFSSLSDRERERMSIRGGDFADITGNNYQPKKPHAKGQVTDRQGNTTFSDKGQEFADSLKNSFGKNNVKPSSLISTVGKKSKTIAKSVISNIKSKLFGEDFTESDIKNYITEEEFLEITEWLVENEVFEDDEQLEYFLMEELNWEYLEQIHSDIEDRAIELIIDSLYDEENGEYTYLIVESVIGDELDFLVEEMVAADVNQSPMPIKVVDCSCGKSSCKSCSKKSWKAKVYEKLNGGC